MSAAKPTVVPLAAAKAERDRKAYAALVLRVWAEREHAEKREVLDRKSEVQIAARERL